MSTPFWTKHENSVCNTISKCAGKNDCNSRPRRVDSEPLYLLDGVNGNPAGIGPSGAAPGSFAPVPDGGFLSSIDSKTSILIACKCCTVIGRVNVVQAAPVKISVNSTRMHFSRIRGFLFRPQIGESSFSKYKARRIEGENVVLRLNSDLCAVQRSDFYRVLEGRLYQGFIIVRYSLLREASCERERQEHVQETV
jgi:hypothetical protein